MSIQGPAAELALRADVPRPHPHRERRIEQLRLADGPLVEERDGLEVDVLEMQSIGDHQAHVVLARGGDHAHAVLDRHRHRLLTEHVDAGLGGADGVSACIELGSAI